MENTNNLWYKKWYMIVMYTFIGLIIIGIIIPETVVENETHPITNNIKEQTYINYEDLKKESVISLLESSSYNYDVIRVIVDYNDIIGNYAGVGMIAKGEKSVDIAKQIGAGLGALFGTWNNKDYYLVSLNNYVEICTFVIDGITTENFMNGEISSIELILNLQSECHPTN